MRLVEGRPPDADGKGGARRRPASQRSIPDERAEPQEGEDGVLHEVRHLAKEAVEGEDVGRT
jgi:hypothetical protein